MVKIVTLYAGGPSLADCSRFLFLPCEVDLYRSQPVFSICTAIHHPEYTPLTRAHPTLIWLHCDRIARYGVCLGWIGIMPMRMGARLILEEAGISQYRPTGESYPLIWDTGKVSIWRDWKHWHPTLYERGFQPRSQPALRRRKQLLVRLAIVGSVSCFFILIFFPTLRSALLTALSLGLLSNTEDLQLETVRYYDLSNVGGTARGWEREERVLMCAPLRDAESHLPMFFSHLRNFTYPHHLIDLAFLVSDSRDKTLPLLSKMLHELQADPDPKQPYGEISVLEKDFGQQVNQDVESRHGFAAQASRRKLMAQARNWLLSAALRPTHSWVYWRDVDVETAPFTILEDLMRHNKDVIVPSKYFWLANFGSDLTWTW